MSRVMGAALLGVEGVAIEVEVRLSSQLPRVDVVGLPEAAVRESAARVRAAISSVGHAFPQERVTVNLAPAGLRKGGAALDLAIAIGILAGGGAIEPAATDGIGLLGELALDGRLRPVRGVIALVIALRDAGCGRVIVPTANGPEAALAPGIRVASADGLAQVIGAISAGHPLSAPLPARARPPADALDLRDVRGQERAKRALEIAAAGGHALLLVGPPGTGKTMLASRLAPLLPPLDTERALEVTRIHSAAGLLDPDAPLIEQRPFRAPHHSASRAGLLGGGSPPRPGEVSLAHHGVLFLDELPEFERRTLEALRQVVEEGRVVLARARATLCFPARVQLVAAANPCPCGWYGSPSRDCRCDEVAIARYRGRVSGPLLDRIDLHVRVPGVEIGALSGVAQGEDTDTVRTRVLAARARQARQANAQIPAGELPGAVRPTPAALALLERAGGRLRLSARGAHRSLRVARSIADLAGNEAVDEGAIAEALSFRAEASEPGS